MTDVTLKHISKKYGTTDVLNDIHLEIKSGEFVVLVGESGCGKSTLLRMIAGLEDITSGDLFIDDQLVNHLPPAKRGIAMVFQSYALYPHMTVFKNIAFGLKVSGQHTKESIRNTVEATAKKLQIDHLLKRLPRELSGGQRQRVAIGRAIVRNPKVFLFDEPLSNLDASLRVQTRVEIGNLHDELKSTVVYVTHDQVEAMTLGQKIVVLHNHGVEQYAPPLELYQHPVNRFVASFIGSPKMNFLQGNITRIGHKTITIELIGSQEATLPVDTTSLNNKPAQVGDIITVGIRPEHIQEGDHEAALLFGKVTLVEQLGEASYLYVKTPDRTDIIIKGDGESTTTRGDKIRVSFNPSDAHLFNADGISYRRQKAGNVLSQTDLLALKQNSSTDSS